MLTCYAQTAAKFGRPPFVSIPEIVDFIGRFDKHEIGIERFTNVRHFRFKMGDDDEVTLLWKGSASSKLWEGGFKYFAKNSSGYEKSVDATALSAIPRTSSRLMVR